MIIASQCPTVNVVRVVLDAREVGSSFQIFFDVGRGFNEKDSATVVYLRDQQRQTLYFPSPRGVIRRLRLDPLSRPGEVRIESVALGHRPLGGGGMVVTHQWNADALQRDFSPHRVEVLGLKSGMLVIRSGDDDPSLSSGPGIDAVTGGPGGGLGVGVRRRIKFVDAVHAGIGAVVILATIAALAGLLVRYAWLSEMVATLPAHRVFVWVALPFGVCYLLLTPPFQAPDEQKHLFRSYQLSTLDIFHLAGSVPEEVVGITSHYVPYARSPFKTSGLSVIRRDLTQRVLSPATLAMQTPDVVGPYIPQTVGVLVGRCLGCSPLVMLYLGRLFNLVVYIGLVAAAIRLAPVFRWSFLALGLMPMSVFLAGSMSYDPLTTGAVFLFLALVLKHSQDDGALLKSEGMTVLFLAAWGVALVKPPYFMVIPACLLIPVRKIGSMKRYALVCGALFASTLLMAQAWSIARAVSGVLGLIRYEPVRSVSFAQAQLMSMFKAPLEFLNTYWYTFHNLIGFWGGTMIGAKLGWLDTALPGWVVVSYAVLLPVVALVDSDNSFRLNRAQRLLLFLLAVGALLIIPTSLYIADPRINPVGSHCILGVQGRYFIPFAPLGLLCLYNTRLGTKSALLRSVSRMAVLCVIIACLAAGVASIYFRYFG